jgi:rare lipoprotein A
MPTWRTIDVRLAQGREGCGLAWLAALVLAACTGNVPVPDRAETADAIPKVEPRSKYGNPPSYVVAGKRYTVLASSSGFVERGLASWYGPQFHGRRTSSGETYDMYAMTAAHPTLPLPTYVQVTNLENGQRAIVRVNDRGPFHGGRVIDLSYAAARKLGIVARGTGAVEVRAIDPAAQTVPVAQDAATETRTPSYPASVELNAASQARVSQTTPSLFVQVGAFSELRNAEQLRAQLLLRQLGEIQIQFAEANNPLYRVRIGPLSSVDAADAMAQQLEALGLRDFRVVVE